MHARFSSDQKRKLASWPAETSSRPSGERLRAEMADGWASMSYVHWPGYGINKEVWMGLRGGGGVGER